MKKIILTAAAALCVFFIQAAAHAHMLWLMPDNYNPQAGEKVVVKIGWGHSFPGDEKIKEGMLNRIYYIAPDGSRGVLKKIDIEHYSFIPKTPGFYLIGAEIKPGFMTKTTTGRKRQTKKGLDNAIDCFRFDIRGKTIIKAGNGTEGLSGSVKHPLEIVPLKETGNLKKGDVLPVKILFNGKPLKGAELNASYAAFKGADHHKSAVTVNTGHDGIARIKLSQKDGWIIMLRHKFPYQDKTVCDDYMYAATLTFEIN